MRLNKEILLERIREMSRNKETLLERIRENGAEDWKSVTQALEDGSYLRSIGIEDPEIPAVEDAHQHATQMAESHPDYKF